MTRHHQWLQDLEGVDALAILTDADLLSHENGHALFYDGLDALQNQCIMISADPDYFLDNLKDALQNRKDTLAHSCPTSPLYATSLQQIIALPILEDQTAYSEIDTCTIRPIYVRKRSDRDARRGDNLLFIKEYHFNLGNLLYTSSWLSAETASFAEIPTEGNVARVDRSDVLRFTNDYYTYDSGRPQLREGQNRVDNLHGQTVVVHNHLTYWTPIFKETWTFFPQHAPYQKKEQIIFREELWAAAKSGYLCDVLIHGDDFEIPAHCIVLRSVPYYKVMFASMLSEGLESRQRHYQPGNITNRNVVKKSQISGVQILHAPPFATESVFRGFLYYVYMGRLPLDVYVSSAFALDLILVADFYDYSELVRDAAHAVRMDEPELVLEVAESIEATPSANLLKERAKKKLGIVDLDDHGKRIKDLP